MVSGLVITMSGSPLAGFCGPLAGFGGPLAGFGGPLAGFGVLGLVVRLLGLMVRLLGLVPNDDFINPRTSRTEPSKFLKSLIFKIKKTAV
uniref:Bm12916 n=1 Tax=Brugia malayi TaxID=6279 RepID=A0A1I9G6A2_BRUMA|nr:Bm12916 [Brugia malayi]